MGGMEGTQIQKIEGNLKENDVRFEEICNEQQELADDLEGIKGTILDLQTRMSYFPKGAKRLWWNRRRSSSTKLVLD